MFFLFLPIIGTIVQQCSALERWIKVAIIIVEVTFIFMEMWRTRRCVRDHRQVLLLLLFFFFTLLSGVFTFSTKTSTLCINKAGLISMFRIWVRKKRLFQVQCPPRLTISTAFGGQEIHFPDPSEYLTIAISLCLQVSKKLQEMRAFPV
uniref:Uncharacterized protein n=1 Tax=Populus davidiana TaxID=266767 RepID=A0A6M2F4G4_9ROSI